MTNKELTKAAREKLLTTTITGKQYADRIAKGLTAKAWDDAFTLLGQIQDVTEPAPDPTPDPVPAGTVYADHDPSTLTFLASGGKTGWHHFQLGENNYLVSDHPTGISDPTMANEGTINIVDDPLGQQGKVYHMLTTPNSGFTGSGGGALDKGHIWQNNGVPWNQQGSECWEHFKWMVKAGQTLSSGHWIWEHHNIGLAVPGVGIVMGIANGKFLVRVVGGDVATSPVFEYSHPDPVVTGRWYDIQFRIKWSTKSDGICEWWLDGARYVNQLRPTLAFSGSTVDKPNYETSNYRPHALTNVDFYFSRVKIASTQEAAAF